MKWIPIEDGLPEPGADVYITVLNASTGKRFVLGGWYRTENRYHYESFKTSHNCYPLRLMMKDWGPCYVVAWAELPKPYTGQPDELAQAKF